VNALCQMTGLNRAGFYRWRRPRQATPVEMELRDQMQKIALQSSAYGYRRITAELQRHGFEVNHKRVLRMMHEDNLLCVRRRSFIVTTDSRHGLPVYPNLARTMTPTAINQLWVADITYIRLRTEFVYLAVVLDAFSRRVIGWALGRTLEAQLATTALGMALMARNPASGLVHHSDRGVQYASQRGRCRVGHRRGIAGSCTPSSNRTGGFPASGSPIIFIRRLAPQSFQMAHFTYHLMQPTAVMKELIPPSLLSGPPRALMLAPKP
jgi:hypothetical protein